MADDAKLQIILEAVNQTASPFNDLVASLESLQKTAEEVAKSIGESVGSIAAAASQMDSGVSRDMEAAGRSVASFQKNASEELNAANKSFNDVKGNMEKGIKEIGGLVAIQMLGQSMEELGKKGEHLFDYAIEQGSDFQQSMQNIKTVIAANADGTGTWSDKLQGAAGMTDQLQQKALDLGSRGAQSANQVAEAMDTMLRAGVDAQTVLGGAAQAAQNVSIVTGDKLDESANLVTEIYHQFRESFAENGKSVQENMKTTGDVLTGTLLSARINSQDFLDTLKYVGPVASQLGSSFLDTATATAVLAQNGIKGSQAGNNLKRALTSLLEPTKAGAAAMSKLGLIQNGHNMLIDESTGKMKNLTQIQEILHKSMDGLTEAKKAQYIHDIFGQYALAGTLVLANENSEAFSKLKEHIGSVSAEQAAASMLNTFSGHMAQLKAHVQTTAKEFGMAFLPALEKLIPIGQKILGWLQELTPANKEFLMGILGVGSALAIAGGALATFAISMKFAKEGMTALKGIFMVQAEGEAAISIFKRFATTMREVGLAEAFAELMSPAVWIALAVAAVVALAMVIIQHWSQIKAFLQKSWEETKKIATEVWGAISKFFTDVWTEVSTFTVTEWNKIKQFFMELWVNIGRDLKGALNTVERTWKDFTTGIQNLWNEFKTWISNTAHAAMQGVVDAFNWLYNHNYYFKEFVDYITNEWKIIKTTTIQIWNDVTKWLKDTWTTISSDASAIWNRIKTFFSQLWDGIKQVAEAFWEDEKRGFERIWNAIVTAANTVWTPIKTFFSGIWDDISSGVSTRWNDIKTTMSQLWNSIISDAESIFNGLETYFTGLWDKALNWGSNLVHMVAQGIRNAASEVAQAASSVASSIASFLGFHSPAKMGPGSDADKWMPNLFKMLTGQVQEKIPEMNAALSMAFHPKMIGVTNMNMYQHMSPVTSGNGSSMVNQYVVNVSGNITENEQKLGDIVSKAIYNKMKLQGKIG